MASLSQGSDLFFFWGWSIMSRPGVPHPGDPWKDVGISRKEIFRVRLLFPYPSRVRHQGVRLSLKRWFMIGVGLGIATYLMDGSDPNTATTGQND